MVGEALQFAPSGHLFSTTPECTTRYQTKYRAKRDYADIAPCQFALVDRFELPTYLPRGWFQAVHPEGQAYFYRFSKPFLRVVTEAWLFDPNVQSRVQVWVEHIEGMLVEKDVLVTEHMELFLEIDDEDCSYYLVDHKACVLFWLDKQESENLGLTRLVLQSLFWLHVEHFPMHINTLPPNSIDSLMAMLNWGTTELLRAIQRFHTVQTIVSDFWALFGIVEQTRHSDNLADGHSIASIVCYQVNIGYGEKQARLSKDQAILEYDVKDSEHPRLNRILSPLTLTVFDRYLVSLHEITVDDLLYVDDWCEFSKNALGDWRCAAISSAFLLCLHASLFSLSKYPYIFVASVACSMASVVFSTFLIYRHQILQNASASRAMSFIMESRSENFGYQWMAFAYALPSGLMYWSLLGFLTNSAAVLCQMAGALVGITVTFAFLIFFIAVFFFASPTPSLFHFSHVFSGFFCKDKTTATDSSTTGCEVKKPCPV
ncbi:hypothetical protein FISHEDRAFT_59699 [Fistulina hepatica ATCC 64428]|uniref:WW domain-containing protein n=1 Tax=Fistulina hepatica ATCC 64428 TaxID=1128425 RepID=A0A0D7A9S4_9AGAR|nr:hypothetical protein FISHEDRAFT_59699 [Fistulina hepatica ATCC 64428]